MNRCLLPIAAAVLVIVGLVIVGLVIVGLVIVGSARASLIGAIVDISANSGFSNGGYVCNTASAIGRTVSGGGELAGADWTAGCVGYYGADITASAITLTPIESGNYSFANFTLNITSGPIITGFSFLGYTNDFFLVSSPYNDSNLMPSISFTSSRLSIVWDTFDDVNQFVFNAPLNGGQPPFGTASFSVTTALPVPEPATIGLVLVSLAGLGMAGRTRPGREHRA